MKHLSKLPKQKVKSHGAYQSVRPNAGFFPTDQTSGDPTSMSPLTTTHIFGA